MPTIIESKYRILLLLETDPSNSMNAARGFQRAAEVQQIVEFGIVGVGCACTKSNTIIDRSRRAKLCQHLSPHRFSFFVVLDSV